MKLFLAVMLSLVPLLFGGGTSSSSDPNERIFKDYQFPGHSGLTRLCGERVYGSGAEITWDAFASPARPAELIDYYSRKLGGAGFSSEDGRGIWRLPANAPRPKRVLDIMPAGAGGPYKRCEKSPPQGTNSIITISRIS